ncbi:hypothetical protein LUR56_26300 [Streptomyces sp. MT29]|nr:hypothetical protein [Streptomyces sp. MT29]
MYASLVNIPRRLTPTGGKGTDWVDEGLVECDPPGPIVVQSESLWLPVVNGAKGGINVLDLVGERTPWVFRLIDHPDRYWLSGDGGRVFLTDGTSLSALPVF